MRILRVGIALTCWALAGSLVVLMFVDRNQVLAVLPAVLLFAIGRYAYPKREA